MQGLEYRGIKDVALVECEQPVIDESEVLVKVKRAGICGSDIHAYLVED